MLTGTLKPKGIHLLDEGYLLIEFFFNGNNVVFKLIAMHCGVFWVIYSAGEVR